MINDQLDDLARANGIDPETVIEAHFNHVSRQVLIVYRKPATVAEGGEPTIFLPKPEIVERYVPWPA